MRSHLLAAMTLLLLCGGIVAGPVLDTPAAEETPTEVLVPSEVPEAAPVPDTEVATEPTEVTGWQGALVTIIGSIATLLITTFLVPWLRQQAQKAAADAQTSKFALGKQLALQITANYAERHLPAIASNIQERLKKGEAVSKEWVKMLLYKMGEDAREELKTALAERGIDWITDFGSAGLDRLLRWAADRVSPFPGKETAVELLGSGGSALLEKGVAWLRDRYLVSDEDAEAVTANTDG